MTKTAQPECPCPPCEQLRADVSSSKEGSLHQRIRFLRAALTEVERHETDGRSVASNAIAADDALGSLDQTPSCSRLELALQALAVADEHFGYPERGAIDSRDMCPCAYCRYSIIRDWMKDAAPGHSDSQREIKRLRSLIRVKDKDYQTLRAAYEGRADETSDDREVQWLRTLGAIVQHFGGRIEIDRRSIQALDLSLSVTSWEDYATNKRVFALVKTISTAEKATRCLVEPVGGQAGDWPLCDKFPDCPCGGPQPENGQGGQS